MKFSRRDFVHGGCTVAAVSLVPSIVDRAEAWAPHGFVAPTLNSLGALTMGMSAVETYTGAFPLLNWRYRSGRNFGIAVTFTGGSSPNVNCTGNGLALTAKGNFQTEAGGALPAGVSAGTTYFVVATGNSFQVATTLGGTPVTFAATGSGNLTFNVDTESAFNAGWLNLTNGDIVNPAPSFLRWMQVSWWTVMPNGSFIGTDVEFNGTQWDCTWLGTTTATQPSFTVQDASTSYAANSATVVLKNPISNSQNVGIQFAITNVNDPPRSFAFVQHQYATNWANGEKWNPDFIAALKTTDAGGTKPFGRIRPMDWIRPNTNQCQDYTQLSSFSDFCLFDGFQPRSAASIIQVCPAGTNGGAGPRGGVNADIICDLANTAGCNLHINIPAGFSNQGMTDFATAVKAQLSPHLYATWEYGNENTFSFNFYGFGYMETQPWPPLGPNSPYQTVVTITGATPSTSPTHVNVPAHGLTTGTNITPTWGGGAGTFADLNKPGNNYNITKIDADNFTIPLNTTGKTFSSGTYFLGSARQFSGYRAAQLWNIIQGVYGTKSSDPLSKWRGGYGVQMADASTNTGVLQGIDFYIANEAPSTVITDLFTSSYFAPYIGQFTSSVAITGVTAGLNPTVTMAANPNFANGKTVRVFVFGGTMAGVLNGTVSYTVSGVSGNTFVINADTTGLTYASGGIGNFAYLSALYDLADDSLANHTSDPVTYPTKYSWFTTQFGKSILNGAADAPYADLTQSGNFNLTPGIVSNVVQGNIRGNMLTNARFTKRRGLWQEQYEGGPNWLALSGSVASEPKYLDYILNYPFQPEFTPIIAALYSAHDDCYGRYPARFVLAGLTGPWQSRRGFPGDASNGQYQGYIARNELGVFTDPNPAWSATRTSNVGDVFFASGSSTTATLNFTSPGGLFVLGGTHTNAATISSIVIDGSISMTVDGFDTHTWSTFIASAVVGAGPHQAVVTYSVSAPFRSLYGSTYQGLVNNAKRSSLFASSQTNGVLDVTRNSAIIALGPASGSLFVWTGSDQLPTNNILNQSQNSGIAWWDGLKYSDKIFTINNAQSNGIMAVAYN